MKTPLFLAGSLGLNLVLAGVIGYLLGARAGLTPIGKNRASVPAPSQALSASLVAENGEPAAPSGPATAPAFPPAFSSPGDAPPASQNFTPALARSAPRANSVRSAPGIPTAPTAVPSSAPPPAGETAGNSVNGNVAGNSLNFRGFRVAVAAAYPGDAAGTALGVDVTPNASSPASPTAPGAIGGTPIARESETSGAGHSSPGANSRPATSEGGSSSPGASPDATTVTAGADGDLTEADELFRMKWGWAAFDAARTEARREAARQRAAQ